MRFPVLAWPKNARQRIGGLTVAGWLALMVTCGAGLFARHTLALPAPGNAVELGRALGALRPAGDGGRWFAVRVLDSECVCSQRIAHHLATTARPADFSELVLWTGDEAPPSELTARLPVLRVSRSTPGVGTTIRTFPQSLAAPPSLAPAARAAARETPGTRAPRTQEAAKREEEEKKSRWAPRFSSSMIRSW